MVFELSGNALLAVLFVFVLWLVGISFFLFREIRNYRRITTGIEKKTLKNILESILSRQQKTESVVKSLLTQVVSLENSEKLHMQKVGVIRFNPFSDTGGKQSFVLALLDSNDTGVVLSSLFSRNGTRWYAKNVTNGKGIEHKLSSEEKEAIKKATSLSKNTK